MIALLILMYILTANGIVVPTGCFIATWVVIGIQLIRAVMKEVTK